MLVAYSRYVDDVALTSMMLCCGCLSDMVTDMHPTPGWDTADTYVAADGSQKPCQWLDVQIVCGEDAITYEYHDGGNMEWLAERRAYPTVYWIPPKLGKVNWPYARGVAPTRMYRWQRIGFEDAGCKDSATSMELREAACFEICCWLQSKYTVPEIKTAFVGHKYNGVVFDILRTCL